MYMVVKYDDDTPLTKRLQTMAEIVDAIRHKKNGKDVRESIAQLGECVVATVSEINIPSTKRRQQRRTGKFCY